ncbi:MAG: hypothetical protein P8J17_02315 [Halioglobus sp.]|nr:hypothetical protein [Halioglobus sp.]
MEYVKTMDYWRDLFAEDRIEVRYEELVSNTENMATWLGDQLGVELDTDNIRHSQQQGNIQTASLWQARQPIHTDSVACWQHLRRELDSLIAALRTIWQEN